VALIESRESEIRKEKSLNEMVERNDDAVGVMQRAALGPPWEPRVGKGRGRCGGMQIEDKT